MPKLDKLPKQKLVNRYIHLSKIKKSLDLRPRRKKGSPPTAKQPSKPFLEVSRGPTWALLGTQRRNGNAAKGHPYAVTSKSVLGPPTHACVH